MQAVVLTKLTVYLICQSLRTKYYSITQILSKITQVIVTNYCLLSNVWRVMYLCAFQTEPDDSSDEDYDPRKDMKKRRLDTSKAGTNKAGGTCNRMSGGARRSKPNCTDEGAGKVAVHVGTVVKTTAMSTGPIGALPSLTVAARVSTSTPTTEVSNSNLHHLICIVYAILKNCESVPENSPVIIFAVLNTFLDLY